MKRKAKIPSKIFANVLDQAERKLILDAGAAENLEHHGLRGGERADALSKFLKSHLPGSFAVGRGEAMDCMDNRTGEIDIFIFDRSTSAPIQSSSETHLIPAEALYTVIEVKTTLTQDELRSSYQAAQRVRALQPFKSRFIAAPTDGSLQSEHYRCPYYIFSYSSNLGLDRWAQKEYDRAKKAALEINCGADLVDRIFVVDRGVVHPQIGVASLSSEASGLFLEFYLHLMNFLNRERQRRPTIDWQAYGSRRDWIRLT